MDSAILLALIESERQKIEPKHRTLELDRLIYGVIFRIFDSMYSAKCETERKAEEAERQTKLDAMTPEERAMLQPVQAAAPSVEGYLMMTSTGVSYRTPYAQNSRVVDDKPVTDCVMCGKQKPNIDMTCGAKSCSSTWKNAVRAGRMGRPMPQRRNKTPKAAAEDTGYDRDCLNCGKPIHIRSKRYFSCSIKMDKTCCTQIRTWTTVYHQILKKRSGIPTPGSQSQADAMAWRRKVEAECQRLGVKL